jgi:LacI family transcriptional regulator
MASPRVTQKQIADELDVRQTTVSRALNKDPRVSPETAKRILAAADRLGYRPNVMGRAMRKGRFGAVGLLESTVAHRGHFFGNFVPALHDALAGHDLHLLVSRADDRRLTDGTFVPRILSELTVDGLVIDYCVEIPSALVDLVQRHNIPSVWVNVKNAQRCVYYDDKGGARAATEHLISLGHRRITYLSFFGDPSEGAPSLHYSMIDRPAGYAQAMKRARLAPEIIHFDSPGRERERAAFAEGLLGDKRPTAILTYSDAEALHLLYAAAKLRLRIPADLSLVATSWAPCQSFGLDVATVLLPVEEAARTASAMLVRLIERPRTRTASVALKEQLWPGESCAPPRRATA